MGDIGNAISGALNTVEHIGSAVGDLASGNVGKAVGDIGQAATSGIGAAVNGFMAANPEMGAIGKLGGGLSSLLGAATAPAVWVVPVVVPAPSVWATCCLPLFKIQGSLFAIYIRRRWPWRNSWRRRWREWRRP